MKRLTVVVLAVTIVCTTLLAGVALLVRPAATTKGTAWGDLCLYAMNKPPGVCVNLPNKLPLL